MALTPGQQACVDALVGPVAVSAGAGSGKTFTLTRRIVHALEIGFVSDIDEVLAITFTSKAAGEIKSRVKGALRACGRFDQALKVDAAWISTIHGACGRILRAHALELGIEPAFAVADEATARTLLDTSLEEVLGSESDLTSPGGLDELFEEYPARALAPGRGSSVEAMVHSLVEKAAASPEGLASLVPPPAAQSVARLAEAFADAARAVAEAASGEKPGKSRDKLLAETEQALERLEAAAAQGSLDPLELVRLMNAFPVPGRAFGSASYKERAVALAEEYRALAAEARLAVAEPRVADLLSLVGRVSEAYARRKREAGLLDNNDLLTKAARALSDHPSVAAAYADRFKLIMVDEFQDTDQIQVDMVSRLAGAGLARLCTVGDAQQSIYRFRGADVGVYERQLASVRDQNPAGLITLSDNFRSHVDVLAFVDRVFSQPSVFGRSFLSLSAARDEARVKRPFLEEGPRVEVQVTTYPHRGVGSEGAAREVARRIAGRFAALRASGHAAGDMVVLLGTMARADVYAAALRAVGLPCVVAGGSVFNRAPEVRLMVALAQAIANPHNTEALFEVLSSELFALSADDLIALATGVDELRGIPRRRALDRGFADVLAAAGEGNAASPALALAASVIRSAAQDAAKLPLSRLMARAVVDSGWVARLEAQGPEGLARAANAYKAIRIAEDIERAEACGVAGTAERLALRVEVAKEAPGALSAEAGDFVRIMTIHASKGLEFPLVAVAELRDDAERSAGLVMATIGGRTYLSLDAGRSIAPLKEKSSTLVARAGGYQPYVDYDDEQLSAVLGDLAGGRTSLTPAEARAALRAHEARGEAAESRRLLYVALTRAKEALIVALAGKRTKDDPTGLSKGVAGDVERALCEEGSCFAPGVTIVDFGGERPCRIERIDLEAPDAAADAEGGQAPAADAGAPDASGPARPLVDIPALAQEGEPSCVPAPTLRARVASYSSLAEAHLPAPGGADAPAALPDDGDDDAAWAAICASLSADDEGAATDLGTAFHRLAQAAVDAHVPGEPLVRPGAAQVAALARACHLGSAQRARLEAALDRWFGSSLARRAAAFSSLRAEVPFFVERGQRSGRFLEGELDLLALDEPAGRVLVVDYKTGGSPLEEQSALARKHLFQAQCYAYAVLLQGFQEVELVFVRVEQGDPVRPGEPQEVRYRYQKEDLPALEEVLS